MKIKDSAVPVLQALRAAGTRGLTNAELLQPDVGGNRFGARLGELRDVGCSIPKTFEGSTNGRRRFRYRLDHEPLELIEAYPPPGPVVQRQRPRAVDTSGHIPGLSECSCDGCLQRFAGEAPADHQLALLPTTLTAAGGHPYGVAA